MHKQTSTPLHTLTHTRIQSQWLNNDGDIINAYTRIRISRMCYNLYFLSTNPDRFSASIYRRTSNSILIARTCFLSFMFVLVSFYWLFVFKKKNKPSLKRGKACRHFLIRKTYKWYPFFKWCFVFIRFVFFKFNFLLSHCEQCFVKIH